MRPAFIPGAAIAALLLLVGPPAARPDVIYLKNGKQIQCEQAWVEGKEVRYRVAQGMVGIPRSIVSKIVKTPAAHAAQTQAQTQTQSQAHGGKPDSSQQEAAASAAAAPKSEMALTYTRNGLSLVRRKDFPGALEYFQKACALEKNQTTLGNLAMTYFMLKDDWNAELYFNQLLQMKPDSTLALNYLGEIAWRKEDLDAAQSYWQRSLKIKHDPDISLKLSRLNREKKASERYENSTSRHFVMRYDGGTADPGLVRDISDFLETGYQQLSTLFESYPDEPFIVVLYPKQQFFRVTEAPFWSTGLNDGKIRLPIKGVESFNQDLQEVLIHELTHSFINYKTGGNCPAWLQEGVAQYSEGRRVPVESLKALAGLMANGTLPSVTRLNGSFGGVNSQTASVLYLESLSFTEFLIDRYRFYQLNQLLDELDKGANIDQAFEQVYLAPLERLEEQWRSQFQEVD